MVPVLAAIRDWAEDHVAEVLAARETNASAKSD
jgi:hypothetical protein